ncbi:acyl-CoA dehydrogenase family protein [Nocardioides sp. TF02-7]|uniref:acyl-CoA dehydrogenase family protein n=1 Tax=Nocardioides sp. TF02-7 TaxID=2917724 RepID=UPI001F062C9A|nr:acyl-CoA dehydrogenase family protein [Nocardioides sp. TF02-7]UMG91271.1 acyl-CoA dehydrogenase family protein [Nocardioides sp. TF02-7]
MDLETFRADLTSWVDVHADVLAPAEGAPDLGAELAHLSTVKRLAYDAGFIRWGWPERVGGLGGSSLFRALLGEVLTSRRIVAPGAWSMTEVLAPTMIDFAPPALAAQMVPRLLRGDEHWCQGFSEPGTGSNLASLACRARRTDDGWRVTGQKVWTSHAQHATRCVLLTRTGSPESAHRGITALFVDMDTPGITVRPLRTIHGVDEFCEVFFDDVLVPLDRTLGEVDGGWAVAMDLLPYERSTALWHRGAYLRERFEQLLAEAPDGALDPAAAGDVALRLFALRARSRATQHRLAEGGRLGPETSVDKALLGSTEQALYDVVEQTLAAEVVLGDDPRSGRWRSEYLYSRAATIYGGTAEVQRNILAPPGARPGAGAVIGHEERRLFADSVRQAFVRAAGAPADAELAAAGWRDALAEWGGDAVAVVLEEQGAARGSSSVLDDVLCAAAGVGPGPAVVLPYVDDVPPARRAGDRVTGRGVAGPRIRQADEVLLVAAGPDGCELVVLPTGAVSTSPLGGIDPDSGLVDVAVEAAVPQAPAAGADWRSVRAAGQLALAAELVGLARGMLRLGCEHATSRVQFGRPISTFQAVRHRLVESLLAIEAAAAAVDAATDVLPGPDGTASPDAVVHAAMSKALAGRAARDTARHCQQVLAGIGFTDEHPFHHHLRRALLLDELLGSSRALVREVGGGRAVRAPGADDAAALTARLPPDHRAGAAPGRRRRTRLSRSADRGCGWPPGCAGSARSRPSRSGPGCRGRS